MKNPWMSPEEVAAEYGLPVATIYSWRSKGYGPRGAKVGRHVRYSRAEVERWIHDQLQASA